MSTYYPCVHWDKGKCKKFSDDKVISWCVEGPCCDQMPSNADRIRSMSDEELAAFLCKKFGRNSDTCHGIELCKPNEGKANGLLKWLQHPAEPPKEE